MKKIIKLTSFLVCFLFLFSRSSLAQEYSLSISPPLVEIKLQPGKSLIKAFNLENNGQSDLYLTSRIVPFQPKGEAGKVSLLDNKLAISQFKTEGISFGLINVSPGLGETFLLKSGEKKQLILKISALESAKQKDHYFSLLVEQTNKGEFISQSASTAKAIIGSNVLLSVSQTEEGLVQGQIAQFRASPSVADIFDKVDLKAVIINGGEVFFKINGGIEVRNWQGKTVKKLAFRPDNVLAAARREAACWQEESLVPCQFKSTWPGRYKAVLSFYPNEDESQIMEKEIVFWLLPIKIVLGLLTSGILAFFVFVKVKEAKRR